MNSAIANYRNDPFGSIRNFSIGVGRLLKELTVSDYAHRRHMRMLVNTFDSILTLPVDYLTFAQNINKTSNRLEKRLQFLIIL